MLKNFKCERCGECCRSPKLYKQDIERIKRLGYKEEDFIFTDNFGNNYIKEKKGWCMFLKKFQSKALKVYQTSLIKGKITSCKIYKARPKTCRLYPAGFVGGDCKPIELAFDRYLEKRIKN